MSVKQLTCNLQTHIVDRCSETRHECLVSEQLMYQSCRPAEADLQIGELRWGDSGVYFCKVIIADDLEGKNEGQLELLVLGRSAFHIGLSPLSARNHLFQI